MATDRSFSAMLNEYLANDLLKEEFIRRDYMLSKIEKDDGWKGGNLVVPFKSAGASSVAFGALSASNDISEDSYVRGGVSSQKEVWGSMVFNHRDLMEHDKVSEQNFLKILPDAVEDFMDYMKNVVSVNLLNGAHFSLVSADNASAATGLITVASPDRFILKQKIYLKDDDSATSSAGYVQSININTGEVQVDTTRAGGTGLDLSAYTIAQNAKVYHQGADPTSGLSFSSLRGALLSAANGGDTNLYGVAKTTAPYLQAINVDGSDITGSNIMLKIFDALTTIRRLGKGSPSDIIMSYTNLAHCMKVIEASKGAFNVSPGSQKASQYGWTEIEVGSVTKGGIKLVGVQEMDNDIIHFVDWRALKFYSNGFFRKRKSPDGVEYFETRATTGYTYIVDVCLFGELVVHRPNQCGIIYGISI